MDGQGRWFYADANNRPIGPLSFDELQRLAGAGTIAPETLVIAEGETAWKPYAELQRASLPPLPPQVRKSGAAERAFAGGCLGFVGASVPFTIGLILCFTGIGAIIGIPMILISLGIVFFGPMLGIVAAPRGYITAACPYCGHKEITAAVNAAGLDCPACNQRILIRGKAFERISHGAPK